MKKNLFALTIISLFYSSIILADTLYGIEPYGSSADGHLLTIDIETGLDTIVTTPDIPSPDGMAFDPDTNTFYVSSNAPAAFGEIPIFGDNNASGLWIINSVTGETTLIGAIGFLNVEGLAFDPNANKLYGSVNNTGTNNNTDSLIVIDPLTGGGSLIGSIGFDLVRGLAFDPNTDTLYGIDNNAGAGIITINTATGEGTLIGFHGFNSGGGLAFDPNKNVLYSVSNNSTDVLHSIDPDTAEATSIGILESDYVSGLAFAYTNTPDISECDINNDGIFDRKDINLYRKQCRKICSGTEVKQFISACRAL